MAEEEELGGTSTKQLINSRVSARLDQLIDVDADGGTDKDLSVEASEDSAEAATASARTKASVLKVDELDEVVHRISSSRGSSLRHPSGHSVKISERVSTKTYNEQSDEEPVNERHSGASAEGWRRNSKRTGPVMKKVVYYSETGSVLHEDTEFVDAETRKSQKIQNRVREPTGFNHGFNKRDLDTSDSTTTDSTLSLEKRQSRKSHKIKDTEVDRLLTKISKVIDQKLELNTR